MAQVAELQAHIAEIEKERDEFCAMVVDLETRLLGRDGSDEHHREGDGAKADVGGLRERIAELERQNQTLDAERQALDAQCVACREQAEQQRLRAAEAAEAWEREREELRERQEETAREKVRARARTCVCAHTRACTHGCHILCARANAGSRVTQAQVCEDKAAALAQKGAELVQLQEELAAAMTESEVLRRDIGQLHGDLELKRESDAASSREKVCGRARVPARQNRSACVQCARRAVSCARVCARRTRRCSWWARCASKLKRPAWSSINSALRTRGCCTTHVE